MFPSGFPPIFLVRKSLKLVGRNSGGVQAATKSNFGGEAHQLTILERLVLQKVDFRTFARRISANRLLDWQLLSCCSWHFLFSYCRRQTGNLWWLTQANQQRPLNTHASASVLSSCLSDHLKCLLSLPRFPTDFPSSFTPIQERPELVANPSCLQDACLWSKLGPS